VISDHCGIYTPVLEIHVETTAVDHPVSVSHDRKVTGCSQKLLSGLESSPVSPAINLPSTAG